MEKNDKDLLLLKVSFRFWVLIPFSVPFEDAVLGEFLKEIQED